MIEISIFDVEGRVRRVCAFRDRISGLGFRSRGSFGVLVRSSFVAYFYEVVDGF